jgi:hypothetical protein
MSETPATDVLPRPAALVNEEIRALAGRIALSRAERDRLAELQAEWLDAVREEAKVAA